ncbi:hypothetical protein [Streptomyces griseiscabiei]|uniref:hypothetical protein n=1 Tax=Streptomyces griseiscabiei TaxID=2993540 RepID=UPI0037D9FA91
MGNRDTPHRCRSPLHRRPIGRDGDRGQHAKQFGEEGLAAKRAAEQEAALAWATQFDMPQLEGPERALDWGERSRRQLMTAAHTARVVEGGWDDGDWAELEEKARAVTRAGWWIDQRDTAGTDLLELLDAAAEADRGTENPYR